MKHSVYNAWVKWSFCLVSDGVLCLKEGNRLIDDRESNVKWGFFFLILQ